MKLKEKRRIPSECFFSNRTVDYGHNSGLSTLFSPPKDPACIVSFSTVATSKFFDYTAS